MAKAMQRAGGHPQFWLEKFLRGKRIESHDRAAHELRCLCEILWAAGCVGQLSIGALICIESACRKAAVIVEAYSVPNRPNWSMARFYRGSDNADEVIAPSQRAHVLRKGFRCCASVCVARQYVALTQSTSAARHATNG